MDKKICPEYGNEYNEDYIQFMPQQYLNDNLNSKIRKFKCSYCESKLLIIEEI